MSSEYTTDLHFQERSSLLYKHSHTEQRARKVSQSNKEGKWLWNERDKGEENKGEQGYSRETESLEIKVLDTRNRILGVEHPDTINAMAHLAATYQYLGKSQRQRTW